jgi:hypothetical protein
MKLRDHPLMAYRKMRNWPPVWIEKYADYKTLMGEIGVLTHVGTPEVERGNRCYLHMTYNYKPYVGSLLFDDHAFCAFVGDLMKKHIQESIEEVGDLDVSWTV